MNQARNPLVRIEHAGPHGARRPEHGFVGGDHCLVGRCFRRQDSTRSCRFASAERGGFAARASRGGDEEHIEEAMGTLKAASRTVHRLPSVGGDRGDVGHGGRSGQAVTCWSGCRIRNCVHDCSKLEQALLAATANREDAERTWRATKLCSRAVPWRNRCWTSRTGVCRSPRAEETTGGTGGRRSSRHALLHHHHELANRDGWSIAWHNLATRFVPAIRSWCSTTKRRCDSKPQCPNGWWRG